MYVIVDDAKNGKEDPLRSLRGEDVVIAAHHRRVRANHLRTLKASAQSMRLSRHGNPAGRGSLIRPLHCTRSAFLAKYLKASIIRLLNKSARAVFWRPSLIS